jgi:hypothetical protein
MSVSNVLAQSRAEEVVEILAIREFLADGGFGQRHPAAPEELEQFGRLAGIWEATQEMRRQDGSWAVVGPALWTWRYTLGGFAVQDLWYQAEEELPSYLGNLKRDYLLSALRTIDVRSQTWKIAWTANGMGQVPGDDFGTMEAKWDGTQMVLTAPPNDFGLQRVTFHDIRADSFSWLSEFSRDGGESWQAVMRVTAKRLR